MSQDNLQVNSQEPQELMPDEAKAGLGLITRIQEQMLKAQAQEQPQTQETGATSDLEQKDEETPVKEEKVDLEANNKEMEKTMDSKLDELRKEIKETIKEELSGIKDSIKEALEDEE